MRIKALATAMLFAGAVACDETLTVAPTSEVAEDDAIVDAPSARAALAGAYDALQDGDYYGGDFLLYSDLLGEDVEHTGTFSDYAATDANRVLPENESLLSIWASIYEAVGIANRLIERVPAVPGMSQEDKDDVLGQAHFIRALSFHDLVKLWGDVPMPLAPLTVEAAAQVQRTPAAQVYTQILADLTLAEQLIANTTDTRKATVAAATALRSRVELFLGNYQNVIDAANALEPSFSLAASYSDLFSAEGQDTPEDIFRVSFTAVEFNNVGFFYISRSFGGRWEVSPTFDLINAYGESWDPAFDPDTVQTTDADGNLLFNPGDPRAAWSISFDASDRNFGTKIPTAVGAEDIHVIRFGEVILNKAESYARLGGAANRVLALTEVNRIRARVGAPALNTAGAAGMTDQQVIDLVLRERRLELAMEGFRWPDLVRTGLAVAVMGAEASGANRVLPHELVLPIPQAEIDVSPGVVQTTGY